MPIVNLDSCQPCFSQAQVVISNPCTIPVCEPLCTTGCPVNLDSTCVFYNKDGGLNRIPNINLPNGANLKDILDRIDYLLGASNPFTFGFSGYDLGCLKDRHTITNFNQFVAAVAAEICGADTSITTNNNITLSLISNLKSTVISNNLPILSDACSLGITPSDTVATVLEKLKDGYCALASLITTDNSPSFVPFTSTSVSWTLAGTKNHTPTANVRISATGGNQVVVNSDGLYVPTFTGTPQTLSWNSGTRALTISGQNTVTIADSDAQTLSLNTGTNVLTISGGNSVNFTPILPVFSQTAITPNTTNSIQLLASGTANTNITANSKISGTAGNQISIASDGLYVPLPATSADEKVRAASAGVTTGFLDQKLEGSTTGALTITTAFNNITDKVTVGGSISVVEMLNEIDGDTDLSAQLCDMIKKCVCFTFRLINSSGSGQFYDYVDCDGTSHTHLSIGDGSVVELCGRFATNNSSTLPINLIIYNLGFCNIAP